MSTQISDAKTESELREGQELVRKLVAWLFSRKWAATLETQQMHIKIVEFNEWMTVKFVEDNRANETPSLQMDLKKVGQSEVSSQWTEKVGPSETSETKTSH